MKPAVLLVLACACLNAQAEIYSHTNAQGEKSYSDRPTAGQTAQPVELPAINRLPPVQRHIKLSPPVSQPSEPVVTYSQVQLLQPTAQQNLHNSGRSISIQVASNPALPSGHSYQLWLNGQPFGPTSQSTHWTVNEVDRGSHSLQVHVLDAQGRSLRASDSIQVHLHQTSLIQKRRINPCQDEDFGVRPECPLSEKPEPTKRHWWQRRS